MLIIFDRVQQIFQFFKRLRQITSPPSLSLSLLFCPIAAIVHARSLTIKEMVHIGSSFGEASVCVEYERTRLSDERDIKLVLASKAIRSNHRPNYANIASIDRKPSKENEEECAVRS